VGSHLDLVPTLLAYAGLPDVERQARYPFLKGSDLSGVVVEPDSYGPRGSMENPGSGALYTYDMIMSIDGEWLQRNAPLLIDAAAAEAGLEFQRGTEAFLSILDQVGTPDLEKRELFRGIFDGRYKLIRYFGLGDYQRPGTVEELLKNNDVALYDLKTDPEEMNNLAHPASSLYDAVLLEEMNSKLNALIQREIGEDKALFNV
jgi:arylsulfatase